jgi:hypothetical protein
MYMRIGIVKSRGADSSNFRDFLYAGTGYRIRVDYDGVRGSGQIYRPPPSCRRTLCRWRGIFRTRIRCRYPERQPGIAGSVELAVLPKITKKLENTELYVFTDDARVSIPDRGPYVGASYRLASAGVGTRLRYTTKAELCVEGAKSIARPYPGLSDSWRVSVERKLAI